MEFDRLQPTNQVTDIPAFLNNVLETLENTLNPILNRLNAEANTLNLSGLAGVIPNKCIVADSIILTGTTGNVLVVSPDGLAVKASIDKDGNITPANIPTIEGITDSEKLDSVINNLRTLGFMQ